MQLNTKVITSQLSATLAIVLMQVSVPHMNCGEGLIVCIGVPIIPVHGTDEPLISRAENQSVQFTPTHLKVL